MTYRAGDYLTVLPRNPASQVGLALRRFGLAADALVVIESARSGAGLPVGHPVACGELLASYVELVQPAARAQIAQLAEATRCPPTRRCAPVEPPFSPAL
jgi:cytochrome P450/NADPH-cytochrome P450 reductase